MITHEDLMEVYQAAAMGTWTGKTYPALHRVKAELDSAPTDIAKVTYTRTSEPLPREAR